MVKHDSTLPMFDANWQPPDIVQRIWNGKDRHYGTTTRQPYDRIRCLSQLNQDEGPASYSTIDRAHRAYGPRGTKIPGLLPAWPIDRYAERPWVRARIVQSGEVSEEFTVIREQLDERMRTVHEQIQAQGDGVETSRRRRRARVARMLPNGIQPFGVIVGLDGKLHDVGIDKDGIVRILKYWPGGAAAAAALLLGAFRILDLVSDNKMDNVIDWCHVLLPHLVAAIVT